MEADGGTAAISDCRPRVEGREMGVFGDASAVGGAETGSGLVGRRFARIEEGSRD